MNIVLHQCCGPCSIYPISRLLDDGHGVHGYFYNPNIHPYTEYKRRMDTAIELNIKYGISYTVDDRYDLRGFIRIAEQAQDMVTIVPPLTDTINGLVGSPKQARCASCYLMRLYDTAKYAKDNGFEYFTTTLLYSRHQAHNTILALGEFAASAFGVNFWYEDYRKGWQIGIDISKKDGMYRQNYCGCIYSEEERFLGCKK